MPYPTSPFKENFNYKLINSLLVELDYDNKISNEELMFTLKWLCSSPKMTTVRVNTLKNNVQNVLHILRQFLKETKMYIHHCLSNVIVIENTTLCEELDKHEKEVIVDTECASAILRGAHIYAPGVLGMVAGCQLNEDVSIYADIAKKCKKGFQKVYDSTSKIHIGNGKIKMQRHHLFSTKNIQYNGIAVEVSKTISGCPTINENILPAGDILLQNLPSILCVKTLNPKRGSVVIDLCASPGNKTTYIAELMENKGVIIAIDKTPKKVSQLQERCENFGANVKVYQADSTTIIIESQTSSRTIENGPPFLPESFDNVLLDAPCSGLGKRPQLANRMSENEIKSYVPLQRKLFETATKLLKPGGTMVYSTCTITLAENEGIIAWALRTFNFIELLKPPLNLGEPGWIGTSLTEEQRNFVQRFGLNSKIDSVGFFFAYFRKKS
ncbi:tRNA (cytosine(72)-C(5))-methyltransferase NSUN6 [Diorhabda sublineata]|uniref:tRNA (cytosine(72)-C(5))-methyltransferase NSUN6 n=1 Tax=Diorhabda sublineata TaxID=1163346 RepID=UPI0024E176A6|nr:tRNA (cytosine(72)-C(5))-methyltransferase NSUN6 [Diorhabda sublineata]